MKRGIILNILKYRNSPNYPIERACIARSSNLSWLAANNNKTSKHLDTYIDDNGYERFSDSDKPVHRWAAEKKLGRKLKPGEVVHHKDRNKTNNHPNNLHVFPNQREHDRVHKYDAYRFGKRASYQGFDSKEENNGCMVLLVFIVIVISSIWLV